MTSLSDDFRQRAAKEREAANAMIESADFVRNPKKQVIAIVGHVRAGQFEALAEVVDYLRAAPGAGSFQARRAAISRQHSSIRNAVAKGEWDEFDRIVAEYTRTAGSGPPGSDGTQGGDTEARDDGGS